MKGKGTRVDGKYDERTKKWQGKQKLRKQCWTRGKANKEIAEGPKDLLSFSFLGFES